MRNREEKIAGYTFVTPNLLLWVVFLLIPVVITIYFSFTNFDGFFKNDFVGLRNYRRFFSDDTFSKVFFNTISYVIVSTCLIFLSSLGTAVLINSLRGKFKLFFRAVFYTPVLMSMMVVGVVWRWILGDLGVFTYFLQNLGIDIRWFIESTPARIVLLLGKVWVTTGFFMVFYCIALDNVSQELIESSRIDGANRWQSFTKIIFPLLKPTHFFVILMTMLGAFREYPLILAMTGGGPGNDTLLIVQYIYNEGFLQQHIGYASAVSVLFLFFLLFVTAVFYILNKGGEGEH